MAIADVYAAAADYRASGRMDIEASDDDVIILEQLTGVSRFLDLKLGQFFSVEASAVARLFVGDGTPTLPLRTDGCPGFASLTGLAVAIDEDNDGVYETTITPSTLLKLPLNAADGPEARPWRHLQLRDSSERSSFPRGYLVEVTALWGWPAIPQAIVEATIELTGILREESPRATATINEMDRVTSQSPMAMSILKGLQTAYQIKVVA